MNDNHKKLIKLSATYSLSCDGWVPVKVKDWNFFIDSVNELTEENARLREALLVSEAAMTNALLGDASECEGALNLAAELLELLKGDEDE